VDGKKEKKMKSESLTWCRYHKHEVDYDLVHFCQIKPKKGCSDCNFSCTLTILNTGKYIKFEIDRDYSGFSNAPFLDEIRECINESFRLKKK
jgi:hypothetical protein